MRVDGPLRPAGAWRWLLAIGVGVPLLLGVVLASGAAVSWLTGTGYQAPDQLTVGRVDDFQFASPKFFEDERLWIVRVEAGEVIALYDRGLGSDCTVQWRPRHEFMGRTGWFVDACSGSEYDLVGRCFSEACRGALLDRFAVAVNDGIAIVELKDILPRVPADAAATPLSP